MKPLLKSLTFAVAGMIALPSAGLALPPLLKAKTQHGGFTNGLGGEMTSSSGFVSRTKVATIDFSGRTARGEATSAASFGFLRTYGDVVAASSNGLNLSYAWATASFRDNRITDAPGRTGQQGFVTVRYTVDGSVLLAAPPAPPETGQSQSYCYAAHDLLVNDYYANRKQQKIAADGNPFCGDLGCTNFLGVEQVVTYEVTFGTPYDFEVNITSGPTLYSFTGFQGHARADLGHTMTWGGIVAVTDASGNPITDYSDISASGTNYRLPIAPVCAAPSSSLVGWWPGDNNARDIKGANNGALENGAAYAAGRVGQAFSLPGSGARVRVPHSPAIDFNATQDYTIDFWMKAGPQTGAGGTLVEKNGGTYPYSVRLLPTGSVSAAFSDASSTISVTSTGGTTVGKVDDNVWHHIAVVFKHSTKTLELYVDGSLNASQTYTGVMGGLANSQDLFFGARADSTNPFSGSLDEVDIHNGALSLSEIQSIAAAAALGKCRPAVAVTSAVSRKTHGAAGDYDINLPLSGTPGVECRSGGATSDYQIVATFAVPVAITGSPQAEVVTGSGTIGSNGVANGGAVTVSGNTVTIPVTGVTNAQTVIVRLNAADNGASTADVGIPLSLLVGDTNGNGSVTASDIGQVKSGSGQAVTGSNFRLDVTASGGSINASDIGLVKSRSGTQLPPQ